MDISKRIEASRATGLTSIAPEIDFREQKVVVTGAAAGIGLATSRMLHQFGAHVVAVDIREEALKSLSAEFNGERITTLPFDLSSQEDTKFEHMAKSILKASPSEQIDAFIISAGVVKLSNNVGFRTLSAWERDTMIRINATSNHEIYRHLAESFAYNARIVFTSSPIVGRADAVAPGYAISKAVLEDLANQMMVDLKGTDAKVVGWVPPPVQNFLRTDLKPNEPMHAHPHGEDVAELPLRLASRSLKPDFHGQVIAMGYEQKRKKDGITPNGQAFDYMPRKYTGGFLYDLNKRSIASGGGDAGAFLREWDTTSSRQLQDLGSTPEMDLSVSLKDVYETPDHIAAHRPGEPEQY